MHACGNDVGYFRDVLGVTLANLVKPLPILSAPAVISTVKLR